MQLLWDFNVIKHGCLQQTCVEEMKKFASAHTFDLFLGLFSAFVSFMFAGVGFCDAASSA